MKLPNHAAVVLVTFAIAGVAACSGPSITAEQLATEANKRGTLPLDLGDGFRLDTITAEGNTIVSTVTVTDAALASDPGFIEVMRTATTSDICREIKPAGKAYADAGLTVAKAYRTTAGAEILRVDVGPGDCD